MNHPIIELRQYTLLPGKRDILIDLFNREFVEGQESVGMRVVGQFRDLDNPDRFVWMRAFPDMEARAKSLTAFYGGPVWKRHRDEANATMIDWSDVLLLRMVDPPSGFPNLQEHASLEAVIDRREMRSELIAAGALPLATLRTEDAENTYPALPVRTENVFVTFWEDKRVIPSSTTSRHLRLATVKQTTTFA